MNFLRDFIGLCLNRLCTKTTFDIDANDLFRIDTKATWLEEIEACGQASGGARAYVESHLTRYLTTLDFIESAPGQTILELGGSYPHAFTLMLHKTVPDANILIGTYDEGAQEKTISIQNQSGELVLELKSFSFNVETDVWPFPDGAVDVVLCMEIIEHLLLDPCHMFREAHRVLKPGGQLLVSTPNLASLESMFRAYHLKSPYNFGIYSKHGAYGRHNREYVPEELAQIGECSGFSTKILTTRNVYPATCSRRDAMRLFRLNPSDLVLRRQNIFYVGLKTDTPFKAYPENLFDYNPNTHKASLSVICPEKTLSKKMVSGSIEAVNLGDYVWSPAGEAATRVGVMLLNCDGIILERDFARIDFPAAVEPRQKVRFDFELGLDNVYGKFMLRFDLVHEHVCWFSEIKSIYQDVVLTAPGGVESF